MRKRKRKKGIIREALRSREHQAEAAALTTNLWIAAAFRRAVNPKS